MSSLGSTLSFTLTFVEAAFTTFSTLWSPGVTVRFSKLSTGLAAFDHRRG